MTLYSQQECLKINTRLLWRKSQGIDLNYPWRLLLTQIPPELVVAWGYTGGHLQKGGALPSTQLRGEKGEESF